MQTTNNSNTKKWCKDCEKMSLSACKNGCGDYSLPCHILRKLAVKTTRAYNMNFKNPNALTPDFYDTIWNLTYGIKYMDSLLTINKDLIHLVMTFVVDDCYASCNDIDFVNEYSVGVELSSSDKSKCITLAGEIQDFQKKISDEWFAVPGNKEYYLKALKGLIKKN